MPLLVHKHPAASFNSNLSCWVLCIRRKLLTLFQLW